MKKLLCRAACMAAVFISSTAWMRAAPAPIVQEPPSRRMALRLVHAGQPLRTQASVNFTCKDRGEKWFDCGVQPDGAGDYTMAVPAPGDYMIHIEIDEDSSNPPRWPGDYDVFHIFSVTDAPPAEIVVPVPRLMRVTAPWDNARPIEGMLTSPWDKLPVFETPRYSWSRAAPVTFSWEPVSPDAEYKYTIGTMGLEPPDVAQGVTKSTYVTVRVPPSEDGRFYAFHLFAREGDETTGIFFTYDAGAQSWNFRFRVVDKSLPNWIYIAAGAGLLATVCGFIFLPPPWKRRLLIVLLLAAAVDASYWAAARHRKRKAAVAAQEEAARIAGEKAARRDAFAAEFEKAVPKPGFWDSAPPLSMKMETFGDLYAAWHASAGNPDKRSFYKSVYQAVLDHADDEHMAAQGIQFLTYAETDAQRLRALREFWIGKFFHYNQRIDNCANCKDGDMTGFMARDLAGQYIAARNNDAAIALIERLRKERDADVSDYNWALTFETLSRARWARNEKRRAIADIEEGLRRFPSGWQADQLRKTLDSYQKALVPLDEN